jgi:rhodanese-related sulfurtransferase
MNGGAYHADASPEQAWETLSSSPGAALVDVRTTAEWNYVGLPDLSETPAAFIRAEWQLFPSGEPNPDFVAQVNEALKAAGAQADTPIFFLCRSGARSAAAAAAMTAAGYDRCLNVAGGFEGVLDRSGHRGNLEGWKAANLPWVQS